MVHGQALLTCYDKDTIAISCEHCKPYYKCANFNLTKYFSVATDTGLSADYKYFYDWVRSKCEGKESCEEIKMPEWWNLIGETNNPIESVSANGTRISTKCPADGIKYVTGILINFSCLGKFCHCHYEYR